MRLRKGKWEYKLPVDTYELLHGYLSMKNIDFALCFVRPSELRNMHNTEKKNVKEKMLGNVSYISLETRTDGAFLLVYPAPHKAATLKIRATKVFEI